VYYARNNKDYPVRWSNQHTQSVGRLFFPSFSVVDGITYQPPQVDMIDFQEQMLVSQADFYKHKPVGFRVAQAFLPETMEADYRTVIEKYRAENLINVEILKEDLEPKYVTLSINHIEEFMIFARNINFNPYGDMIVNCTNQPNDDGSVPEGEPPTFVIMSERKPSNRRLLRQNILATSGRYAKMALEHVRRRRLSERAEMEAAGEEFAPAAYEYNTHTNSARRLTAEDKLKPGAPHRLL
jgi:hypothetical protein